MFSVCVSVFIAGISVGRPHRFWVWVTLYFCVIDLNAARPFFICAVDSCLFLWTTVLADLSLPTIALLILYQYSSVLCSCSVAQMSIRHTSYLISHVDSPKKGEWIILQFCSSLIFTLSTLFIPLFLALSSRWLKWRLTSRRRTRRPPSSPHQPAFPPPLYPPPIPTHPPTPEHIHKHTPDLSMDLKDRRHRSLTRGRCPKDPQYNTASLDADECRVPTQKSYSSSETLKAFDHEQRLHYSGCVTDLVHHEADEYSRQGGFVKQISL